jgi:protocatechuate 3,4-dioxygenase beta subunit
VYVFAVKFPGGMDSQISLNPSASFSASNFFQSLPLGGHYRLVAREFTETAARWVVSDEFALDDSHPIEEFDLRLLRGRTVTLRVVDPQGEPIPDLAAELQWSCSDGHHSHGSSVTRFTDARGIARFENATVGGDLGPLKMTVYTKIAPPPGCVGLQCRLDALPSSSSADHEARLTQGVSASGVLIDAATGRPIPRAKIRIYPHHSSNAAYFTNIYTTTNARGEFQFDTLEPVRYEGHIEGTVPKGTVVTPRTGGGYRYSYPNGPTEHFLQGGDDEPVEWHVTILPDSRLKPLLSGAEQE